MWPADHRPLEACNGVERVGMNGFMDRLELSARLDAEILRAKRAVRNARAVVDSAVELCDGLVKPSPAPRATQSTQSECQTVLQGRPLPAAHRGAQAESTPCG